MSKLEEAVEKITKLQPKTEDKLWCVGEQIKDIMRAEPRLADIIAEDLAEKTNCLADIEKEIAKYARSHNGCCPPKASDNIIRKYFGLPEREKAPAPAESGSKKVVRLEDFL